MTHVVSPDTHRPVMTPCAGGTGLVFPCGECSLLGLDPSALIVTRRNRFISRALSYLMTRPAWLDRFEGRKPWDH